MEKGEQPKKKNFVATIYHDHYKVLLAFSLLLVVLSMGVIGYKLITTGDFIDKGVSLKGGITVTILSTKEIVPDTLKAEILKAYPNADINVQTTSDFGVQQSIIVEGSDITYEQLLEVLKPIIPEASQKDKVSVDSTDPVLGKLSFLQTLKAIFIAFLFMAIVVFLYFGEKTGKKILAGVLTLTAGIMVLSTNSFIFVIIALIIAAFLIVIYLHDSIPSIAVILAAFSDIIFTVAVLNLLGVKIGIAGIAAFLMLIGYSVDTDILMSVRVLKRKEGSVFSRIVGSMKTGLTMQAATMAVLIIALFFSQSPTINQIMLVLLIGLVADMIFTWIQNAGVLRWYLESRGKK
jgi:preprotein translocase subunit SecF